MDQAAEEEIRRLREKHRAEIRRVEETVELLREQLRRPPEWLTTHCRNDPMEDPVTFEMLAQGRTKEVGERTEDGKGDCFDIASLTKTPEGYYVNPLTRQRLSAADSARLDVLGPAVGPFESPAAAPPSAPPLLLPPSPLLPPSAPPMLLLPPPSPLLPSLPPSPSAPPLPPPPASTSSAARRFQDMPPVRFPNTTLLAREDADGQDNLKRFWIMDRGREVVVYDEAVRQARAAPWELVVDEPPTRRLTSRVQGSRVLVAAPGTMVSLCDLPWSVDGATRSQDARVRQLHNALLRVLRVCAANRMIITRRSEPVVQQPLRHLREMTHAPQVVGAMDALLREYVDALLRYKRALPPQPPSLRPLALSMSTPVAQPWTLVVGALKRDAAFGVAHVPLSMSMCGRRFEQSLGVLPWEFPHLPRETARFEEARGQVLAELRALVATRAVVTPRERDQMADACSRLRSSSTSTEEMALHGACDLTIRTVTEEDLGALRDGSHVLQLLLSMRRALQAVRSPQAPAGSRSSSWWQGLRG